MFFFLLDFQGYHYLVSLACMLVYFESIYSFFMENAFLKLELYNAPFAQLCTKGEGSSLCINKHACMCIMFYKLQAEKDSQLVS